MPTSTSSQERLKTLRANLKRTRYWTLKRFASELGFSPAYIKAMERGERPLTGTVLKALKRLEREEAFCAKELGEEENQVLDWLVTAIEHRRENFTRGVRRRLKKLLE